MSKAPARIPNPRRVAAGRENCKKRKGLTDAGRERLRESALRNKPWKHATGPRTPEGKKQAVLNAKQRQSGTLSIRESRAELAQVRALIRSVRELCAGIEKA